MLPVTPVSFSVFTSKLRLNDAEPTRADMALAPLS
jgi:hypothetical protein